MGARIPVYHVTLPDTSRVREVLRRTGFDAIFSSAEQENLDLDLIVEMEILKSECRETRSKLSPHLEHQDEKITPLDANLGPKLISGGSKMPISTANQSLQPEDPDTSETVSQLNPIPEEDCDLTADPIPTFQGPAHRQGNAEEDVPVEEHDIVEGEMQPVNLLGLDNYFLCLGHNEDYYYFYPMAKGQIVRLKAAWMRESALCELADISVWEEMFSSIGPRGGRTMNWGKAASYLIRRSQECGIFDTQRISGLGCWKAGETIVCNFGRNIYIHGTGITDMALQSAFVDERIFVRSIERRMPDFDDVMTAGSRDIEDLYDLVKSLHWRKGTEGLSSLAFLGWLALAPICGVIKTRPFLWLYGPNESGKTWIMKNIVLGVLGDFCINTSPTTSVQSLRKVLYQSAMPVIVDMADFNKRARQQSQRLEDFLDLARQSCDDVTSDSFHFEANSSTGEIQRINTRTSFIFASKTSEAGSGVDMTGSVRAALGTSFDYAKFTRDIAVPAERLINEGYSLRFLSRMISRAPQYEECQKVFLNTLGAAGCPPSDRKLYATICAGAWLLLEAGIPNSVGEAQSWIERRFGNALSLMETNIHQNIQDWRLALDRILAHKVKISFEGDSPEIDSLGNLIQVACGIHDEGFSNASTKQAYRMLEMSGLRLTDGDHVGLSSKKSSTPKYLAIHPSSGDITNILRNINLDHDYAKLFLEADSSMKAKKTIRFSSLGTSRPIMIELQEVIPGIFDDHE